MSVTQTEKQEAQNHCLYLYTGDIIGDVTWLDNVNLIDVDCDPFLYSCKCM